MDTSALYNRMKQENIVYLNHKLSYTRGAIAHYNDIVVIIVDKDQVHDKISENTVIIQELGHYLANAYYNTNSKDELICQMELKADVVAWKEFFPYSKIRELMSNGITTATMIAEYFEVEAPYIARCLNYYYKLSDGFKKENLSSLYDID